MLQINHRNLSNLRSLPCQAASVECSICCAKVFDFSSPPFFVLADSFRRSPVNSPPASKRSITVRLGINGDAKAIRNMSCSWVGNIDSMQMKNVRKVGDVNQQTRKLEPIKFLKPKVSGELPKQSQSVGFHCCMGKLPKSRECESMGLGTGNLKTPNEGTNPSIVTVPGSCCFHKWQHCLRITHSTVPCYSSYNIPVFQVSTSPSLVMYVCVWVTKGFD